MSREPDILSPSFSVCTTYDSTVIRDTIIRLTDPVGGFSSFIKPGMTVLVKPNLLQDRPPEDAVTTHPAVVDAVVSLITDCGAKPLIGDSPPFSSLCTNIYKTGIEPVLKKHGLKISDFSPSIILKNDSNRVYKSISVSHLVQETDLIINLPKLKTHCQMVFTMAVKNLFGFITGLKKPQWHFKAGKDPTLFATMLVDLHEIIKPGLSIIDAVTGMEGNGPGNGTPRHLGFMGAGRNAFALDAVCCEILGHNPASYPILVCAAERGLVFLEQGTRMHHGDKLEDMAVPDFKLPDTLQRISFGRRPFIEKAIKYLLLPKPQIDRKACRRCNACATMCPVQAIRKTGRGYIIDHSLCIRCYCCHEICGHDAVSIKKGLFSSWISK